MQAFGVFAESSQASQVTVERLQLVVEVPERSAQTTGVIEVAWLLNIGDPLCERHPQAVVLMRARCDQRTRRDGYPRGRQEPENRDLALKPPFRIGVQRDSSGHHAGNDRGGSQVHEYVAPGGDDRGFILRKAVSVRNDAGGRKRAAFQVNFHQSNLANRCTGRLPT